MHASSLVHSAECEGGVHLLESPSFRSVAAVVPGSLKSSTSTSSKFCSFRGFMHASSLLRSAECEGGVRLLQSLSIRSVAAVFSRS